MDALSRRRQLRREHKQELRDCGRTEARIHFAVCVRLTAVPMPEWAAKRRIRGLTFTGSIVWLRPRDARFLIARDQENGGDATYAETEFRRCSVCSRPLLGHDAQLRRQIDESCVTGRQIPCGSECLEAARDGRWKKD